MKRFLALLCLACGLSGQTPQGRASTAPADSAVAANVLADYVCPMHPDERSDQPGKCRRCGMALKLGIPDQAEYSMDVTAAPSLVTPGRKVRLTFAIKQPKDGKVARQFQTVHEKLFHLFVVSNDLRYFRHEHPVQQADGTFVIDQVFPSPGMYRLAADVYPTAGTPQLIDTTLFVSGGRGGAISLEPAVLQPDLSPQHGENTEVAITTIPEKPISGQRTLVFFKFNTAEGMEPYLGAWAHLLIGSDDLIDLIHDHPTVADGGTEMQFSIIFPRAHTYRMWVQFQRKGVVNTVAVNIPVVTLEQAEGVSAGIK